MWTPWCTSLAARMKRETKTDVTEQLYDLLGSVILILKFRTFNKFQFVFSVTQLNSEVFQVNEMIL